VFSAPGPPGYFFARAAIAGRLAENRGARRWACVTETEDYARRARAADPDFLDGSATRMLGSLYVLAPDEPAAQARRLGDGPRAARGRGQGSPRSLISRLRLAEAYIALNDPDPATEHLCVVQAGEASSRTATRSCSPSWSPTPASPSASLRRRQRPPDRLRPVTQRPRRRIRETRGRTCPEGQNARGALVDRCCSVAPACHHQLPRMTARGQHAEVVERAAKARRPPRGKAARAWATSLVALGRSPRPAPCCSATFVTRRGGLAGRARRPRAEGGPARRRGGPLRARGQPRGRRPARPRLTSASCCACGPSGSSRRARRRRPTSTCAGDDRVPRPKDPEAAQRASTDRALHLKISAAAKAQVRAQRTLAGCEMGQVQGGPASRGRAASTRRSSRPASRGRGPARGGGPPRRAAERPRRRGPPRGRAARRARPRHRHARRGPRVDRRDGARGDPGRRRRRCARSRRPTCACACRSSAPTTSCPARRGALDRQPGRQAARAVRHRPVGRGDELAGVRAGRRPAERRARADPEPRRRAGAGRGSARGAAAAARSLRPSTARRRQAPKPRRRRSAPGPEDSWEPAQTRVPVPSLWSARRPVDAGQPAQVAAARAPARCSAATTIRPWRSPPTRSPRRTPAGCRRRGDGRRPRPVAPSRPASRGPRSRSPAWSPARRPATSRWPPAPAWCSARRLRQVVRPGDDPRDRVAVRQVFGEPWLLAEEPRARDAALAQPDRATPATAVPASASCSRPAPAARCRRRWHAVRREQRRPKLSRAAGPASAGPVLSLGTVASRGRADRRRGPAPRRRGGPDADLRRSAGDPAAVRRRSPGRRRGPRRRAGPRPAGGRRGRQLAVQSELALTASVAAIRPIRC
jgi:hypothetical protein